MILFKFGKCSVFIPSHISDIEVHSAKGSVQIRNLPVNVLATTEHRDITISDVQFAEVSSVSGNILIEECDGCSVRTIDGSITCIGINGSIQVETQNGNVCIDRVDENVAAVSDQGKISVRGVAGRVRLISNKGDIELEIVGPSGGGEIQTYSGDIAIQLEHSNLEFRAETLSGRIETSYPVNSTGIGPQRSAFKTGDGARRLYVKSILGDIEVN